MRKGKLAKFFDETDANGNATHCSVTPDLAPGFQSWRVLIPFWMRGEAADLEVGEGVIFELFEDQTGCLLCRADGTGGSVLPALGDQTIIIGAREGAEALVRADKLGEVLDAIKADLDTIKSWATSHIHIAGALSAPSGTVTGSTGTTSASPALSFSPPADECGAENVKGV